MELYKNKFSDVFRVFFALTMASIGISQSSSFAPDSSKTKSATASIFGIMDKKSKIDSSGEFGTTLDSDKGEIELRHISFKYPSRPDMQIFRELNLVIHSGKTVDPVDESGSRKSTVIALLRRFYDPDSGEGTLDGIESIAAAEMANAHKFVSKNGQPHLSTGSREEAKMGDANPEFVALVYNRLRVFPLIEPAKDLRGAGSIIRKLLSIEWYCEHIIKNQNGQRKRGGDHFSGFSQ